MHAYQRFPAMNGEEQKHMYEKSIKEYKSCGLIARWWFIITCSQEKVITLVDRIPMVLFLPFGGSCTA